MATHSSVLAWRIPGTGEPGGLPSMGPGSPVEELVGWWGCFLGPVTLDGTRGWGMLGTPACPRELFCSSCCC